MDTDGPSEKEEIWTPVDPDDETVVTEADVAEEKGNAEKDKSAKAATVPPAPSPPKPPPMVPTGRGPGILIMKFRYGLHPAWAVLLALFFAYFLEIGFFIIYSHPEVIGGYIIFPCFLVLELALILLYTPAGGIYENGIKVPRPLYQRLRGGKAFFRFEELNAVFKGMYITSANLWRARTKDESLFDHRVIDDRLSDDPGQRKGVAVMTDEGMFILRHVPREDVKKSPFEEMMGHMRAAMDARWLPLIKVPLKVPEGELDRLVHEAKTMETPWFSMGAAIGTSLPWVVMLVIVAINYLLDGVLGYAIGPVLILAVILSTTVLVVNMQSGVERYLRARNRLAYHDASNRTNYCGFADMMEGFGAALETEGPRY